MSEEAVSREEGIIFVVEPPSAAVTVEKIYSLANMAKWFIDEFEYYISNDTMTEIREITSSGGIASAELEIHGGGVTLTVFKSTPKK